MLINVDTIVLVAFIDILSYLIYFHMNSICFFMKKINDTSNLYREEQLLFE